MHKPCIWREIIYPPYSIDLVQCMCRATTASPSQTVTREAVKERGADLHLDPQLKKQGSAPFKAASTVTLQYRGRNVGTLPVVPRSFPGRPHTTLVPPGRCQILKYLSEGYIVVDSGDHSDDVHPNCTARAQLCV